MSTLRVSTIQDTAGSNSSTPAAIANGIAKAWVNFNGTGTVAIRAQYNVSSITDNGTGDYTVNFTNALADANYAIAGAGEYGGVSTTDMRVIVVQTRASGNVRIATTYSNGAGGYDLSGVHVAIFR